MKIAITGATGNFGRSAIQTLSQQVAVEDIIALARNTEKAQKLLPAGIEIRPGSYEDVDQLTTSLAGVDRLLFISSQPGAALPRLEQHRNVVKAAQAAGVKLIAYTSFPHADTATTPLATDHRETEALITATGIKHIFLRNNWYLENEMGGIQGAQANQPFYYSAADGQAGWALERDYAEAAANAILLEQPKSIYELAGDIKTYPDLAQALQTVTGHDFAINAVNDTDYRAGLVAAGLDEGTADFATMVQQLIRDGNLDAGSSDLPMLLGRPLPSLTVALQEIIAR